MQFKNPEILYALFLLFVPILIHLFQLRRFKKTDFTNVLFLKALRLQTRKSSQIKKWLVLCSRLLLLGCLILAFARPYIPSLSVHTKKELVIYLDNSFSMQAKGKQGELLKNAVQQLIESETFPEKFSWFTNDFTARESNENDLKTRLLYIDYSFSQLSYNEVLLKAEALFSTDADTAKELLIISDFQSRFPFPEISEKPFSTAAVVLKPENRNNISIDSAYIASASTNVLELNASISNHGETAIENIPVSLYQNGTLTAKTTVSIPALGSAEAKFEISSKDASQGEIKILDESLRFDNELFFNIGKTEAVKVLAIQEEPVSFLRKIYSSGEFEFLSYSLKTLDYNLLTEQNTIILNQLENIPISLQTILKSFSENGGTLIIIPHTKINIAHYNTFLTGLGISAFEKDIVSENQVTTIHFSHPLYQNVFENQITNFQYPTVNSFYTLSGNLKTVLSFQDQRPFLAESGKTYLFTAALNSENSNFTQSPLVVPTFYRIAKQSLPLPEIYYTIGKENRYVVPASTGENQILTLQGNAINFIPLQQNMQNRVLITTTDEPAKAGTYTIFKDKQSLQKVSYNYSREESITRYLEPDALNTVKLYNQADTFINNYYQNTQDKQLWKLFVIFALVFVLIELLLLKFFK